MTCFLSKRTVVTSLCTFPQGAFCFSTFRGRLYYKRRCTFAPGILARCLVTVPDFSPRFSEGMRGGDAIFPLGLWVRSVPGFPGCTTFGVGRQVVVTANGEQTMQDSGISQIDLGRLDFPFPRLACHGRIAETFPPGGKSSGTTALRSMRIKVLVSISSAIGGFLTGARPDAGPALDTGPLTFPGIPIVHERRLHIGNVAL